jgi:hypothetical protein
MGKGHTLANPQAICNAVFEYRKVQIYETRLNVTYLDKCTNILLNVRGLEPQKVFDVKFPDIIC